MGRVATLQPWCAPIEVFEGVLAEGVCSRFARLGSSVIIFGQSGHTRQRLQSSGVFRPPEAVVHASTAGRSDGTVEKGPLLLLCSVV